MDLLPKHLDSLHFYVSGLENDFGSKLLFVPEIPLLHKSTSDKRTYSKAKIGIDSTRFLSVSELGLLQLDTAEKITDPVFSGPIEFSISLSNQEKKNQLLAAFEAIEEVYGLTFSEVSEGGKLILTDQTQEVISKEKLYLLVESGDGILPQNVIHLEKQSGLTWEELIEKGLLPELILAPLVHFLGIHSQEKKVNNQSTGTTICPNS
ncbi:hypothetical protein [Algoriphagus boritolerans]|uniref:hypothetical protein n=1 Tax=Algoriphagus boritolerans TaxID=308111 RepID=UPI000B2F293A